MNVIASAKHSVLAAIAALILISSPAIYGQSPQATPGDRLSRPLNLLVLGDSISWGQGLKDEHKAWYLVKTWLHQITGRDVHERIEAHSGAVIGSVGDPRSNAVVPLDGELSRGLPSVNDQVDDALKSYADPAQVDLVLVDGCINDVDSRRLLNAATTPEGIRDFAQLKCGPPVEALLGRITTSFPNAHVIVTGYYPIISEKTANDFFIRALAKRFYTPEAGVPAISDKELRARLIAISKAWYQASNQMLAAATLKVDAQLRARGSRQRVLFAEVVFLPEHSFAAGQSRLWGFDASALRKLLVILTLGRVTLKANDEKKNQRSAICSEVFKGVPGETEDEKLAREGRIMRCRVAAIGHPNRKGAVMYSEAIGAKLKFLLNEAGWLKDTRTLAAPGNRIR